MKTQFSLKTTLMSFVLLLTCLKTYAGPGTLIDSPLFVSAVAKPNIMFLADSSGSMRHILPVDGNGAANQYDADTTYYFGSNNCGGSFMPNDTSFGASNAHYMYLNIISNTVKISIANPDAGNPVLGGPFVYTPGRGPAGTHICFDSTKSYYASLYADTDSATVGNRAPGDGSTTIYSGNYLNWYFDLASGTPAWTNEDFKPGTRYRMQVLQTTLNTLVDSLNDDVRLGLASFNGNNGAYIDFEIADLNAANKTAIKTKIDALKQGSETPMAEALHQLGLYFMGNNGSINPANAPYNGKYEGDLILHPSNTPPTTVAHDTVFPTNYAPSNYQSPIQYWCQSNFVVFMSDGVSNADNNIPDAAFNPLKLLQDYDGDCDGVAGCDSSNDQKTADTNYSYGTFTDPVTLLADNGSDYLDDVAQALFEIDLRPDIDDADGKEVKNNIITYTIAFADQQALNNKLLKDAANQAGGLHFSSNDANELTRDFTAATTNILSTTSSAAAVTFNTSTLGSDTAVYQALFSTSLWSGEIHSFPVDPVTGDIDTGCTVDSDANCWDASTHLNNLAYNSSSKSFLNNRKIITYNPDANSGGGRGIAFRKPADFTSLNSETELTRAMLDDLCTNPSVDTATLADFDCTATASGTKKTNADIYIGNIVDYIRGNRKYEDLSTSPSFRVRDSILGDIINSTPAFVGVPQLPWPSEEPVSPAPATDNPFGTTGARYSDFIASQSARPGILYTAANDGMLHAFRAEDKNATPLTGELGGDELFAYLPAFVFSTGGDGGYHYLSNTNYRHKYYLDLSLTFSDVYTAGRSITDGTVDTTLAWRTVLIGGSRGGDKIGLFALDVTNPENITETNSANVVLWEFTNVAGKGDPDLGHTYSKPTIALTNVIKDGTTEYRWAAIFGNGYQNDSGTVATGSDCHAKLFIVFIDGGLDGSWTKVNPANPDPTKDDYFEIDTPASYGSTAAGDCNGLSTPALADLDGNGTVDRVYAGDVKGNMWAFDLGCVPNCGGSFDIAHRKSGKDVPLFSATDGTNAQPIMVRPTLARNTQASGDPNILVMFGTGQYHAQGDTDISSSIRNTFYSIWDQGDGALTDDRTYTSSIATPAEAIATAQEDYDNAVAASVAADAALAADPTNPDLIAAATAADTVESDAATALAAAQSTAASLASADTSNLVEQRLETETVYEDNDPSKPVIGQFRFIRTNNPVDYTSKRGWYIDLDIASSPNDEERVVVNPVVRSNVLFFNTLIPNAETCGFGGSGWLMSVDFLTGSAPDASVFDVNGNDVIGPDDKNAEGKVAVGQQLNSIPANSSFIGDYQYTQGSDGSISKRKINIEQGLREGRLSWREIREAD